MSSNNFKRYTVTAALPYANGPLHLGHIAGAYLPSDIFVRYLRLKGEDVLFIGGSDEHGVAITLRAKKEGISPQQIIDKYHYLNKENFEKFGISFDMYHRTSEPIHHETSQGFFSKLYDKGEFIEKVSEQFYDEEYDQFLADRYVVGTCPVCKYENAYGDQCENCGTSLNATDLINPKSTLSGKAPIVKETKHWYLPLDKYQPWLEKWLLEGKKGQWKTNVYGQCSSWLQAGLQPRAMTRDLDWGVDVPLPGTEGKKLYVWLDAPIGYISSTKQWAQDHGKDWELYWKQQPDPKENSTLIHFIGKDNIVFHCIIFPSILHAHGEYILPENVPANEFLNLEGKKISTSRNWAVWLHEYLEDFPGKEDVLRYVLCTILPETKDSEFTWKDFQSKNNNELVAILGNFINRTLVLTQKYFGGTVPERYSMNDTDREALSRLSSLPAEISTSIENFRFREAISLLMDLARAGNKYLADTEPWKVVKQDEERVKTILNISLQICRSLSILGQPFMPTMAQRLRDMLNLSTTDWSQSSSDQILQPGHQINQPSLLFEKIEDQVVEAQVQKLENALNEAADTAKPSPAKDEIAFPDFEKIDIRVATIMEAEKVKKSKKLLKLKLDTGLDQRTVLSGIAEYYKPEDIIGKQVCVLANLAPRKMMGTESQGMVLMAEDSNGKLSFINPEDMVKNGSTIS